MAAKLFVALSALSLLCAPMAAADEARVRVVDVGNGMCVIAQAPGGQTMLYDAGNKSGECFAALQDFVPPGGVIDLMVLSHSDADHIGEAANILDAYTIIRIIHPGDRRTGVTLRAARNAMAAERRNEGAQVLSLARTADVPALNQSFRLGAARVYFIAGWNAGQMTRGSGEPSLPQAESRNAISIVMRFVYGDHSVLFTGDTIGRLDRHEDEACHYAERIMVERAADAPIQSDVLVGQHHGGNNSSSACFIEAVDPRFVVFPAGNGGHEHPRATTVARFLAWGINAKRIYRTDRGDDEPDPEWDFGTIEGCEDPRGDDDVEIVLPDTGNLRIRYRTANGEC